MEQAKDPQEDADPALHGLVVLDVSRVLAGPYCSMMLADLGADVIKIERPPSGDDTRSWGPPYLGDPAQGLSAYFLSVNRGKRSVCLDLKRPAGHDLFVRLVQQADVLIENFAPGVADRLGLGTPEIVAANSRIIHCSITGFGDQAGPAYDLVIQGMSGLMSITGAADGPPMKVGVAITDVIAGLQASNAILAAVVARQRTGHGDRISIGLLSSAVASLVNIGQAYLVSGTPPRRWENAHPQIAPYQVFASSDGHFTVAAGNDKLFANLCRVIGRADLPTDARFATNPQRIANRQELISALERVFATKCTSEWLGALRAASVPSGPVSGLRELFDTAQLPGGIELLCLETSSGLEYKTVGSAARMAGRCRKPTGAPLVGEHTDEVLRKLVGCETGELEQLRQDGAIQ